jgi:hypothetical protein
MTDETSARTSKTSDCRHGFAPATCCNCLKEENERLRAYLNGIADGAHEGAHLTWIKSMAVGALRGDPILVGEAGSWRRLPSETCTAQHAELLKKLPRVGADFVEEIQALSRAELERRVLIQKDWVHSYSRCLDGLDLKVGVESCRDPRDIRRIVESLRPAQKANAVRDQIAPNNHCPKCDSWFWADKFDGHKCVPENGEGSQT